MSECAVGYFIFFNRFWKSAALKKQHYKAENILKSHSDSQPGTAKPKSRLPSHAHVLYYKT